MNKYISIDEGIKLIEFIELAVSGQMTGKMTQDEFSSIEGAIKEAKEIIKNIRLAKLVEECSDIPDNRKLFFVIDLFKTGDMYRINEGGVERESIFRDINSRYLKAIKKEVKVLENAKNKITGYEGKLALNKIIETKNALINELKSTQLKRERPTDLLKHSLFLSFKSIWCANTDGKKMNDDAYNIASYFVYEFGYNNKGEFKGEEIREAYDLKAIREMFTEAERMRKKSDQDKRPVKKIRAFYQRNK